MDAPLGYLITDAGSLAVLEGYTGVRGSLSVDSVELASLAGLECLHEVTGDLSIRGSLVTMDGLEGLSHVGGSLSITNALALTNVDALGALVRIDDTLYVETQVFPVGCKSHCPAPAESALANLDGLAGLRTVGRVQISWNSSLVNVDGLGGLTEITGDLDVFANHALTSLRGLGALRSISGHLRIATNSVLTNVDGLEELAAVRGDLGIDYNPLLENLDGLSGLTSLGGSLSVRSNYALPTCDPAALSTRLAALGWTGTADISMNDAAGTCPATP